MGLDEEFLDDEVEERGGAEGEDERHHGCVGGGGCQWLSVPVDGCRWYGIPLEDATDDRPAAPRGPL